MPSSACDFPLPAGGCSRAQNVIINQSNVCKDEEKRRAVAVPVRRSFERGQCTVIGREMRLG